MSRHQTRLLLCISILFFQAQLCSAQEIGVGQFEANAVYSDAYAMESFDQGYAASPSPIIGQSSYGDQNRWFARLGVGSFLFGESATLRAGGAVVPGAGVRIKDETTFAFDIGYYLSPRWTATLSFGVPPKLDLEGTGPFEGANYGTTRYAPLVLALQRHVFLNPKTSVYVGGGVNYTMQYESVDSFVQNLDIDNNAAAVLQLGIERRLNSRISLFADAKKAFYETEATGSVGGAPIVADITVNPTVLFFGVKYDF